MSLIITRYITYDWYIYRDANNLARASIFRINRNTIKSPAESINHQQCRVTQPYSLRYDLSLLSRWYIARQRSPLECIFVAGSFSSASSRINGAPSTPSSLRAEKRVFLLLPIFLCLCLTELYLDSPRANWFLLPSLHNHASSFSFPLRELWTRTIINTAARMKLGKVWTGIKRSINSAGNLRLTENTPSVSIALICSRTRSFPENLVSVKWHCYASIVSIED